MSTQLRFEMAHSKLKKWTNSLRGNPARNSQCYDVDPPYRKSITIQSTEAIDCFVKNNPEWIIFSDKLRELETETLVLDKELWYEVRA